MFGVGFIGAGPGVSALHLPTLARLEGRFHTVHISDGGGGRARLLASRLGVRASTGQEDLLRDPEVAVVAICSPPEEHAGQVLAAVASGVRGIFCEKPLAMTDEDAIAVVDACRTAGAALVVGTNHLFDPAWGRAKHHLDANRQTVRSITISAAIGSNDRYHALVTEPTVDGAEPRGATGDRGVPDWTDPEVAASIVRRLVLGLGVHDLPILRDLVPQVDHVVYARPVPPLGYAVGLLGGDVFVQANAVMRSGDTDTLWRITITTDHDRLDVDFPPPFVHAGSASVRVLDATGNVVEYARDDQDGYIAEWAALGDLLERGGPVEYDEILADALYAISLADEASEAVRAGMSA